MNARTAAAALALTMTACGHDAVATDEIVAIGDSIARGQKIETQPGRMNYPWMLGDHLRMRVQNLGVNGISAPEALTYEVPRIDGGCRIVTIELGINDIYRIFDDGKETEAGYRDAMKAIVGRAKQRCPHATVLVSTIRQNGRRREASRLNDVIRRLSQVGIVDIERDPQMNDPNRYIDGVHPDAMGQRRIAEDFEVAYRSTLRTRGKSAAAYDGASEPAEPSGPNANAWTRRSGERKTTHEGRQSRRDREPDPTQ